MVYDITENATLHIKHSTYNLEQLLYDKGLAKQFINGKALVFRLDVSDYHRYLYFDEGKVIKTKKIDGILNTVKPIAFQNCKVFIENAREYQVLNTQNYGKVVYMEVGALNVGKVNNYKVSVFKRGMEKGYFSFGGSTIVLLFQEGMASIDKDILDNSNLGRETIVKYGESIGK